MPSLLLRGSIPWRWVTRRLAVAFAAVWYPFRHLYDYHTAVGTLPDVSGGLRILSLLGVVTLGLVLLWKRRYLKRQSSLIAMLIALYLACTASWTIIHFLIAKGPVADFDFLVLNGATVLDYLLLVLVGLCLDVRDARWPFVMGILAIAVNTAFFFDPERFTIQLFGFTGSEEINRLAVSTTGMITGLVAWSSLRSPSWRMVVLVGMIPLLFVLGGRANLVLYLAVLPLAVWFTVRPRWQVLAYATLAFGAFVFMRIGGIEALMGTRQLRLLEITQDTSFLLRMELLRSGVQQIVATPLVGDYGGYLEQLGGTGYYIHNFLSVWQNFGLFAFLLYSGLIAYGVLVAGKLVWRWGRSIDRNSQLFVVLVLIATGAVLTAKAYIWSEMALVWGLLVGLLDRQGSQQSGGAAHE